MRYDKIILPFTALVLMTSCGHTPRAEQDTGTGTTGIPDGSGAAGGTIYPPIPEGILRFDGVYHGTSGHIDYFIRFFPQGNAALLAGFPDPKIDLREYLKQDMAEGFSNGHNVPVTIAGDSILFITSNRKGDISYHGFRVDAEHLTFRKHSHVNGRESTLDYVFESYP